MFLIPFLLHSLEMNSIGDGGAAAVADGLAHNRTLKYLK
jgi:hypothetical protein